MVPPGLVGLDHVDEEREGLLLHHRDRLEMPGEALKNAVIYVLLGQGVITDNDLRLPAGPCSVRV